MKNAGTSSEVAAVIDGPYGGKQDDLTAYSTAMLIAGSTGVALILPILSHIADRVELAELPLHTVHLVWATKDQQHMNYLSGVISGPLERLRSLGIQVISHLHVTDTNTESSEKQGGSLSPSSSERSLERLLESEARVNSGRPSLRSLIQAAHREVAPERMGVALCGPVTMAREVRTAVTEMENVYLHVEGYSL